MLKKKKLKILSVFVKMVGAHKTSWMTSFVREHLETYGFHSIVGPHKTNPQHCGFPSPMGRVRTGKSIVLCRKERRTKFRPRKDKIASWEF